MSVNRFVSIVAWGYEAARQPALVAEIERVLREEMIFEFFFRRGQIGPLVQPVERIDGAPMVVCGSFRPAIIASLSSTHMARVHGELLAACGQGGAPRVHIELRSSDDEMQDGSQALNERVHAAECCLWDEIEALRGKETRALADALAQEYFHFPSWDQRDAMICLLVDLIGHTSPPLERMWRDALARPVGEQGPIMDGPYYSRLTALAGLAGLASWERLGVLPPPALAGLAEQARRGVPVLEALAALG